MDDTFTQTNGIESDEYTIRAEIEATIETGDRPTRNRARRAARHLARAKHATGEAKRQHLEAADRECPHPDDEATPWA
jgi:DnaJ-domain-containing protein 1